ncbi:DNA polymerase processivity factor [Western grey kangaroopox virus]|uniref:DNA polymerase processivity factor n=1 Tax=Western grey kangaroopox virus TaxID=1566307 RepID=A0A2C9DSS6_9POXV|nr:DNA polymerase processivity factor [Western grey kangaroopox virus]ATI21059.1 DNA polymerase processivity factor [Western grey kangaroopox virus]
MIRNRANMSKAADLSKLKELLELRRSMQLPTREHVGRYNELLEWAQETYWHVPLSVEERSLCIERYYRRRTRSRFSLVPGNYYFALEYFGIEHVFSHGTMVNRETGREVTLEPKLAETLAVLESYDPQLAFLKFACYRGKYVLEDAVSSGCALAPLLERASELGLLASSCTRIRVESHRSLTEEHARLIERRSSASPNIYATGLICVREGETIRDAVDFGARVCCCVQELRLDSIGDNLFLPYALSFAGDVVRFKSVDQVVDNRVHVGSFVSTRRSGKQLLMVSAETPQVVETRNESVRRLLKHFRHEYFINGAYLSKTSGVDLSQIRAGNRVKVPCRNLEEMVSLMRRDREFAEKIVHTSPFDVTCEYLSYDRYRLVKLINHIEFRLESGRIDSFSLDSRTLLREEPDLELIYLNFHVFVVVFNMVVSAKEAYLAQDAGVLDDTVSEDAGKTVEVAEDPDTAPDYPVTTDDTVAESETGAGETMAEYLTDDDSATEEREQGASATGESEHGDSKPEEPEPARSEIEESIDKEMEEEETEPRRPEMTYEDPEKRDGKADVGYPEDLTAAISESELSEISKLALEEPSVPAPSCPYLLRPRLLVKRGRRI